MNKMILAFRHMGIVVTDMERAIEFYCKLLEHKIIVDFIEKGEYFNHLIGMKNTEARVVKANSPDGSYIELIEFLNCSVNSTNKKKFTTIGCNHICFTVERIFELYDKLVTSGVEFVSPPLKSDFDPVLTCFCYDPDGTLVQFVEITDHNLITKGLD
jgi:catechol 2,3-dioxygenase-like lactoylglutathione lyase family enzyme